MATSQHFSLGNGENNSDSRNQTATTQHFSLDNGEQCEAAEPPAEEPPFEMVYMSDRKIKYFNNKYEKLNAHMYDQDCDIKIKIGDTCLKGHRKVLADASDYFDAMFTHEMKEKNEAVVVLKELSPAGVSAMLDYFYHGHVSIEDKIVPNILEAGRFFHVEWILDICCDYMIRHLSMYDYALTMELADRYALGDIRWDVYKYYGHSLPQLLEKESFYRDTCFDFMFQYLMEGMYVDVAEFTLLQMVLKWVEFDESRSEHLAPLLRQIRFPIMDLEELEDIPQEVMSIRDIREEVEEAKMYCLDIPTQCLKTGEKYQSRGSRTTVMLTAFSDDCNVVLYKDPYDDGANLFIENLGPSGLFVDYSTTNQTSLGNFLFAAGGYNDEYTSSNFMYRYDPRDREWTQVASMTQPRVSFAMCNSKNRIYVIGGVYHVVGDIGEETILASVEMYDPEKNEWRAQANLPYGIFDLASAHCRDKIYVSGGISNDSSLPIPLKNVFSLTEGQDKWSPLPDMLNPRQGHSMSAVNDKLYILGGYTSGEEGCPGFKNCYSNEVFDIETQQWTTIAPSPEAFGHFYRHVGVLDSKIFFLCTEDSEVFFASYDTEKDEYSETVNVGTGLCKVNSLAVGYPYT